MKKNLDLRLLRGSAISRKMAMGTWKTTGDPTIYGDIEIDMTKVLEGLENYQENNKVKITPAHLIGKAIAHCMKVRPEINGLIRGRRIYLRKNVTLFYQVNIEGKPGRKVEDAILGGVTIEKAEDLSTKEIAEILCEKGSKLKKGEDKVMMKNLSLFKYLPWWLSRLYLNLGSWLIYGLNRDMTMLGLPRDPFGSVMITNAGGLGIDRAWAPLVPYSRIPFIVTIGTLKDRPVAVEGKVEVRKTLPLGITLDHRMIDGTHAAFMAKELKKCFDNPNEYLF